jgi:quinol-cytochrome oxidoreductase complex cytochrome b subunit
LEEVEKVSKIKGRARNLVLHLHPPRVSKESIRFTLTFGLGGMAAVLFLLQIFTGLLLRFIYVASPAEAYDSILTLQDSILFGQLIRNLHHWSGIFFVLVTFLHLLRTFYTGAFYWERRWNWVIGIVLMVLVIFSNFTGYLLPWDQLAFWAITVSTSMLNYIPLIGTQLANLVRGGNEVGAPTLLIFYNFHTAILPLALVILMTFHFWRVRKNKGVVVDQNASKEMVPADPDLVTKELTVGLALIAFVLLISIFFNAPLQERADPAFSPNPAKAPWYFMGVQELLLHFHPFFSAVLMPGLFLIAMFWLPFTRFSTKHEGIWFLTEKGKKLTLTAMVAAAVFVPAGVLLNEYVFDFEVWMENIPAVISNGLIPFLLTGIVLTAWFLFIKKRFKPDKSEMILFIFTFVMTAYAMLTFIGIWFRGAGMVLTWP